MKGLPFLLIAVVLVLVVVVLPFLVFANTTSFAGAFLYWTVVTLAVIVGGGLVIARWRDA